MLVACLLAGTANAESPETLVWSDLAPPPSPECVGVIKSMVGGTCPPPAYGLKEIQCGFATTDLDGRRVRIAGYVQPLEFAFRDVRRFLLSRPLGPCRHPSSPPANQLILVDYPAGHDITADPVFVTGVIEVETIYHDVAVSRWRLKAERVEPALIPDVIAD